MRKSSSKLPIDSPIPKFFPQLPKPHLLSLDVWEKQAVEALSPIDGWLGAPNFSARPTPLLCWPCCAAPPQHGGGRAQRPGSTPLLRPNLRLRQGPDSAPATPRPNDQMRAALPLTKPRTASRRHAPASPRGGPAGRAPAVEWGEIGAGPAERAPPLGRAPEATGSGGEKMGGPPAGAVAGRKMGGGGAVHRCWEGA
ncbi:hypothetical protein PAHAL_4G251000 [Panicum hallii]|jgi:hypothetical protein|uniref:Uncharacterized protein n=1 Tax=Panicum hallii TaxID=206008 RepID=A0A2T8JDU9_9POAL|nr:hypothetical protein PAHAL_4G251000 [Panicum hallii]